MSETITVEIDLDGSSTVSVAGVKGKKCKDITRQVEAALGKVTADTPTQEMAQRETVKAAN